MSNLENNKIFAAVLTAGITLMLTGFIADQIFHHEKLEKDAVTIEGASGDGHGAAISNKPQLPEPIMAMLATADIEKGAKISKACAACHSFDKGGPVKQGPNLWGVVGRAKASASGFSYSDAMAEKGGEWDYDALNHLMWKPKKYIPGTKMNFAGLKKAKDRAALIGWLREQSDAPAALPTDAEIEAEQLAFAPPAEEAHEEGGEENAAEEGTTDETAEDAADVTPHAGEEATSENAEMPAQAADDASSVEPEAGQEGAAAEQPETTGALDEAQPSESANPEATTDAPEIEKHTVKGM